MQDTSSGSSSSTPPSWETAGKWGNTTQQATFIMTLTRAKVLVVCW